VLGAYLRDNVNARILKSDGSYEDVAVAAGATEFDSQQHFIGKEV
jgi:hypothetical protein